MVTPALTVGEVVSLFNVRQFSFRFTCESGLHGEDEVLSNCLRIAADDFEQIHPSFFIPLANIVWRGI